MNHGPKISELLVRPDVDELSEEVDRTSSEQRSGLIYIIIPEEVAKLTRPDRLISVIGSVTGLYSVCATLAGRAESEFGILALDSGSDKSIVFAGIGEVAAAVRGTITDVWDRVIIGRHAQADANLDLIAKSLPIISDISRSRDAGSLSPEQAELMKRKAIECATGIVDAGALTIELEARQATTPRSLIQEKQLLLTSTHVEAEQVASSEIGANDDVQTVIARLTAEVESLKSQNRSVRAKKEIAASKRRGVQKKKTTDNS